MFLLWNLSLTLINIPRLRDSRILLLPPLIGDIGLRVIQLRGPITPITP